ncbi:MAG: ABC transporter ATP-binding protein/permease [Burkholderiales bacterium]|nr:ABC transporter ATP-binding protein/permease [Burkholderiales bacterium]
MKYILTIIKDNYKLISIYIMLGVTSALLSTLSISYFQKILEDFSHKNIMLGTILIYGLILAVGCILSYVDEYPQNKLANSIYFFIKGFALQKMSTIKYESYLDLNSGVLLQKIENGSMSGKKILFDFYLRVIRELIPSVLFSLFFIALINKTIVAFIVIGYILVFIITRLVLKLLYSIKEKSLINEELINKILARGIVELVTFRLNKQYQNEINKFNEKSATVIDQKTKMVMIHESFFAIFAFILVIVKIAILILAYTTFNLEVGSIVALILYVDKVYNPIAIFNVLYVQYKLDLVSFKRLTEFFDAENDSNLTGHNSIVVIDGNVKFNQVSLKLNQKDIIKNISFEINKGNSYALIGESGAGKSSIIKLITGLIKPSSGQIFYDSYLLNEVDLNCIYDQIYYISQETSIFDGTLRENIIFNKKVSDKEVKKVLNLVKLEQFFSKLPNGLNTELGEKGIKISGGEKQRVALARIFFSESKIVILDEATSGLDRITEQEVFKNIIEYLVDRTIIIVAHNLKTITHVDKVLVIKDGVLVENDSLENLLNQRSHFYNLWHSK